MLFYLNIDVHDSQLRLDALKTSTTVLYSYTFKCLWSGVKQAY